MVRTQIFLTPDEVKLIKAESIQRRITKSEVIREALDSHLGLKNVSKEKILEALNHSTGLFKVNSLRKRIRRLRADW